MTDVDLGLGDRYQPVTLQGLIVYPCSVVWRYTNNRKDSTMDYLRFVPTDVVSGLLDLLADEARANWVGIQEEHDPEVIPDLPAWAVVQEYVKALSALPDTPGRVLMKRIIVAVSGGVFHEELGDLSEAYLTRVRALCQTGLSEPNKDYLAGMEVLDTMPDTVVNEAVGIVVGVATELWDRARSHGGYIVPDMAAWLAVRRVFKLSESVEDPDKRVFMQCFAVAIATGHVRNGKSITDSYLSRVSSGCVSSAFEKDGE